MNRNGPVVITGVDFSYQLWLFISNIQFKQSTVHWLIVDLHFDVDFQSQKPLLRRHFHYRSFGILQCWCCSMVVEWKKNRAQCGEVFAVCLLFILQWLRWDCQGPQWSQSVQPLTVLHLNVRCTKVHQIFHRLLLFLENALPHSVLTRLWCQMLIPKIWQVLNFL